MRKGFKFSWLAKTILATSQQLLFILLRTELGLAAEIPLFFQPSLLQPIKYPVQLRLESQSQGSMTSVYQLSDVQTSDWAFQAWQSLAQRYDCPSVNLNITKRNNRFLSRSEFAADLHTCLNQFLGKLDQLESRVAAADLKVWQRLQTDFATELATLERTTSGLEVLTQQLQENLFSTTTKLEGEVLWQLADSFGDNLDSSKDESQTLFGDRFRLNFDTSFYGSDLLRTRIKTTNIGRLNRVTGTVMTRLGADGEDDNEVALEVNYSFLVGDRSLVIVGTGGVGVNKAAEVLNPLSSSGKGAVSRFGRRDPLTLRASGSTGIALRHQFSDRLQGNLGYSISSSIASSAQTGLFNNSYNAIAQLVVEPADFLELAVAYTRKYQAEDKVDLMSSTGSFNANRPFGDNATAADNWGLQFHWYVSDRFEFGGWFGYAQAERKQGFRENATILNGAFTFAFPDLWSEGNLGGIVIGIPPTVTTHDNKDLEDQATSWHLEALYRIKVADNIEVTPGFFLVTNPNHESNKTIWVGTIRSRFSF